MCSAASSISPSTTRCRKPAVVWRPASPMSGNSATPLVRVRGLSKAFGANQVLKGVDLDVRRGEVVSVIGASGSGKTTLLRCVNLLETYDAGSIEVDGVEGGF